MFINTPIDDWTVPEPLERSGCALAKCLVSLARYLCFISIPKHSHLAPNSTSHSCRSPEPWNRLYLSPNLYLTPSDHARRNSALPPFSKHQGFSTCWCSFWRCSWRWYQASTMRIPIATISGLFKATLSLRWTLQTLLMKVQRKDASGAAARWCASFIITETTGTQNLSQRFQRMRWLSGLRDLQAGHWK